METDKYKKTQYIVDEVVKNKILQVTVKSVALNGYTRYELEKSEVKKGGVKVTVIETVPDSVSQTKVKAFQPFGEMITLSRMSKSIMDWDRKQIMAKNGTINF